MAQQVSVSFVDDMDGSEAEGTVSFGLEGRSYEIDLSSDNASKLREALAPYVAAARRAGGSARIIKSSRSTPSTSDREHNQAVREWALAQGMDVASRGRLSTDVVEAYANRNTTVAAAKTPVVEVAEPVEEPVKKPRRSRAKAKVDSQPA